MPARYTPTTVKPTTPPVKHYPQPLLQQKLFMKSQKPRRRRQAALRRFLTMLLAIGCIFALIIDHAHPQGVHGNSLASFSCIGGAQEEVHQCCAPFLSTQRRQLNYMYCNRILHIIYILLYNVCEYQVGAAVG